MPPTVTFADEIRAHLHSVSALRQRTSGVPELAAATRAVKRVQARRFRSTYADLASDPQTRAAVDFFLDELYGEHDFSRRDEQFGRIAGALERLFPAAVAQLAVDLTEMHALTEQLDASVAEQWLAGATSTTPAERYVLAWRQVGGRDQRQRQLAVVQHMGQELQRLTRMRSLRLGLRMMRKPAEAAGLADLQHFLESGFDAFAALRDSDGFLRTVADREALWIDVLFDAPMASACRQLDEELARTPP